MFDLGWTELAVVALVALVVIGPKDLPKAMRTVGQYARKLRGMAREFQSGLDELAREAELDEAKKAVQGVNKLNPKKTFSDAVDPTGEVEKEVRDLDKQAQDKLKDDEKSPAKPAGKQSDEAQTGEAKAKVVETPASAAPGNSVKPPASEPKTAGKTEGSNAQSGDAQSGGGQDGEAEEKKSKSA